MKDGLQLFVFGIIIILATVAALWVHNYMTNLKAEKAAKVPCSELSYMANKPIYRCRGYQK